MIAHPAKDLTLMSASRILEKSENFALPIIELAAWFLGLNDGTLPHLPQSVNQRHANLVRLCARKDSEAIIEFLAANTGDYVGEKLLMCACFYAGPWMPNLIMDFVETNPSLAWNPAMLCNTHNPTRLVSLISSSKSPVAGSKTNAIVELILRARASDKPLGSAEALWKISAPNYSDAAFYNSLLRLKARESLDSALDDLLNNTDYFSRAELQDGATAVLGRLFRQQPERAINVVFDDSSALNQVQWLHTLVRDFQLHHLLEPNIEALLHINDKRVNRVLARPLVWSRAYDYLANVLESCKDDTESWAFELAPGVYHLGRAGLQDDVNKICSLVSDHLRDNDARDIFNVLANDKGPSFDYWLPDNYLP